MKAAASVTNVINQNPQLFANVKVAESGINILYIHEAMWVEKKLQSGDAPLEGRTVGGVLKSALGYFEALSEMGVQANLKEIDEFDFSKNDYTGSTIILAHQIAVPSRYWQKLQDFVSKGGKLIAEGLTAYYDENAVCIMQTGFPFEKMFGGNIKEFKRVDNIFNIKLTEPNLIIPAHLWRGTILPTTAKPISILNNEVIASRNKFGRGEVVWVPALLGLGGRITKDYSKLSSFLNNEAKQSIRNAAFAFKMHQPKMLMKTMRSGDDYIIVVINKSKEKRKVELKVKDGLKPNILFADRNGSVSGNTVLISPEETIVIQWK
jgi:beta-galactosidase